jgi:hypothetical protein
MKKNGIGIELLPKPKTPTFKITLKINAVF